MDLNRTNTGVIVEISCPNPFDYCLELFSLTYKNTNTLLCLSSNRSRQISVMHSCSLCLSTSKQPKYRINRLDFIVFSHSAHCNVCWHLRCHHPLLLKCHPPPPLAPAHPQTHSWRYKEGQVRVIWCWRPFRKLSWEGTKSNEPPTWPSVPSNIKAQRVFAFWSS